MQTIPPAEAVRRVAEHVALNDGLLIVVCIVPLYVPEKRLHSFAQELLPGHRQVLHNLDRDGYLLVESPWEVTPRPFAVVAWGLDLVGPERRDDLLRGLNLARDSLRRIAAPVVLFIPESATDALFRHCTDLVDWRSVLVRVELEAASPERRRVLDALLHWTSPRSLRLPNGIQTEESLVTQRLKPLVPAGAERDMHVWLGDMDLGVVVGTNASGRSNMVRLVAHEAASMLLRGEHDGALLLPGTLAGWSPAYPPDLEHVLKLLPWPLIAGDWPDVVIVIEQLGRVAPAHRDHLFRWLEAATATWSPGRLRFLLVSTSIPGGLGPRWSVAMIQRWSTEEARLWMRQQGAPDDLADRFLVSNTMLADILLQYWREHRRTPRDLPALFEEYLGLPTDDALEDVMLRSWETEAPGLTLSEGDCSPAMRKLLEAGWLVREEDGTWTWTWLKVPAWLVARALVRRGELAVIEAVRVHASDRTWHGALRMAVGRLVGGGQHARIWHFVSIPPQGILPVEPHTVGRVTLALAVAVYTRSPRRILCEVVKQGSELLAAVDARLNGPSESGDQFPPGQSEPHPELVELDAARNSLVQELERAQRTLDRMTYKPAPRDPGTMTPEARRHLSTTLRALHDRLISDLRSSMEREYRLGMPFCGPDWAQLDLQYDKNRKDVPAWWREHVRGKLGVWREKSGANEAAALRRQRLEEWLYEQWRAITKKDKEKVADKEKEKEKDKEKDAAAIRDRLLDQIAREAAYTLLNRVLLLRILESTGLRRERVIIGGWNSAIYKDFRQIAPALCRDESEGYATLLGVVFDELAEDLPGLYGNVGLTGLVTVPSSTLRHLIEALDDKLLGSCWSDDTLLGWVYQYWNDPDREALDKKLNEGGKLADHEIASKTQMFTERYLVEWMLQNTLGPMWLAMCRKNGWTAEVEADGTLDRLEARRADWRERREHEEVPPEALMPIETAAEEHWKYYVRQPLPTSFVEQAPATLRALRLLDPSCGSGHFLVIAFDLLFWLYREEARQRAAEGSPEWSDTEIVTSILANNLHGLDIDPRAVQIAAAALWLKAQRQLNQGKEHPELGPVGSMNLVASALRLSALPADDPALMELCSGLGEEQKVPSETVLALIKALRGADHLGTLLQVDAAVEAMVEDAVQAQTYGVEEERQATLFGKAERKELRSSILERVERFLGQHTSEADLGLRLRGEQLVAGVRYLRMLEEGQYDVVVGNPPYQGTQKMADAAYVAQHYPAGKADLYAAFLLRGLELAREGGLSALLTMRGWMFVQQFKDLRSSLLGEQDLRLLGDVDRGAFEDIPDEVVATSMSMFRRLPADSSEAREIAIALQPTPPEDRSRDSSRTSRKRSALLCQFGVFPFRVGALRSVDGWPLVYWWDEAFLRRYASTPKIAEQSPARFGLTTGDNVRFTRSPWELSHCSPSRMVNEGWAPFVLGSAGKEWFEPLTDLVRWASNGIEVKVKAEAQYGSYTRQIRNEDVYFQRGVAFAMIGAQFSGRIHRYPSVIGNMGSSVYPDDTDEAVCLFNSTVARKVLSSLNPGVHFEVGDVNRLPLFPIESADEIVATLDTVFTKHESHRETSVEFRSPGPTPWRHAQAWAQEQVDRRAGTPLAPYTAATEWPTEPADRVSFAIGVALGRFDAHGQGILDPKTADLSASLPHGLLTIGPEDALDDSLGRREARPLHDAWAEHGKALGGGASLRDWLRGSYFPDEHRRRYENRPIYLPISSEKRSFVAFVSIHRWTEDTLRALLADWLYPTRTRLDGELADLLAARQGADKGAARQAERRTETVRKWRDELEALIKNIEQIAEKGPPPTGPRCPPREQDARYAPVLDDGVMVNAAALWPLLAPQWKDPQKWWSELAAKDPKNYDWSQLAARYFPRRVAERCVSDPSIAVAHHRFWRHHARRAWSWELRLQDEIGPDFRIDEPDAAEHRAAFLAAEPDTAIEIVVKEADRRRRKAGKDPQPWTMTWYEPGLWRARPRALWDAETELIKKWEEDFRLIDPDEPAARAALLAATPRLAAARADLLREVRNQPRGPLFRGARDADPDEAE